MDAKRNLGIGYNLSDDGGATNLTLKKPKRTNRENKVCRNGTDESSKLEGPQSDEHTKARDVKPSQMGVFKEGVVLVGYAHKNVRVREGGEEMVIKVAGCGEG